MARVTASLGRFLGLFSLRPPPASSAIPSRLSLALKPGLPTSIASSRRFANRSKPDLTRPTALSPIAAPTEPTGELGGDRRRATFEGFYQPSEFGGDPDELGQGRGKFKQKEEADPGDLISSSVIAGDFIATGDFGTIFNRCSVRILVVAIHGSKTELSCFRLDFGSSAPPTPSSISTIKGIVE